MNTTIVEKFGNTTITIDIENPNLEFSKYEISAIQTCIGQALAARFATPDESKVKSNLLIRDLMERK